MSISDNTINHNTVNDTQEWVFEINNAIMDEYAKDYFRVHKRASVHPLKTSSKIKNVRPVMPSMNQLIIMRRPQFNELKKRWGNFMQWYAKKLGYEGLMIENIEVYVEFYFWDRSKHDIADNYNLKFINDGLTACGFLAEDNNYCLQKAHYIFRGLDRENPRTIITFKKLKREEIVEYE